MHLLTRVILFREKKMRRGTLKLPGLAKFPSGGKDNAMGILEGIFLLSGTGT